MKPEFQIHMKSTQNDHVHVQYDFKNGCDRNHLQSYEFLNYFLFF